MIVGVDFGTTNSGMSVYDGRQVTVLPLDPGNANPRVLRTALYITNEQAVHIGRAAVDHYYEHNIGRVVKTRKVWIGEIEVYAEDLYYVTDAYAWVDISEPGRLMLSVKSRLREEEHPGAIVGQYFYTLEDLIALYLTVMRVRAEQQLGQPVNEVVLGRPVHFSFDEEHDRLAQGRLLQAAFKAGYEKVYLQYEPIAAAYNYETAISGVQNVLVFDFGGGTLDITIMRLGDPAQRQVLATGGVPIAGDVFDQKLTRARLPKHFGEGSYYGPRHKAMTTPKWIYDAFSSWQTIIELQSQENRRVLEDIARTAQRRYQIEALISLVTSNYGLKMFDEVEHAKRVLSTKRGAEIRLDGPDFKLREFVTRGELEQVIHSDVLTIEAELKRTVAASGLEVDQIDAVIRTGGSAQIPVFYEMLCRSFGREKVHSVDVFSSVASGLGVIGHRLEQGELDLRAYTPDDVVPPPMARGSRPQVSQVNVDLLQNRIAMDEGAVVPDALGGERALVVLGEGRHVRSLPLPPEGVDNRVPVAVPELAAETGHLSQALLAKLDEQLLVITTAYRFLLTSPRQLAELQAMDMGLSDLHRLGERESFCALASWAKITAHEKLLLLTTRGFARAYPLGVLAASIEAPVPLKFDHPLPGVVVSALGVNRGDMLLLSSANARALRLPIDSLRIAGLQVMNCGSDDQVVAGRLVTNEQELLPLTADGYGRRILAEWVPVAERPNAKGPSLVARRSSLRGISRLAGWVLTSRRLLPVDGSQLPLENSTRTYPLAQVEPAEEILAILA